MGITIFFILCVAVLGIDVIYQTYKRNQSDKTVKLQSDILTDKNETISKLNRTILDMAREISYTKNTRRYAYPETVAAILKRYGE